MKKLYTVLGILSLALGIIGAFLPILPTTPFILLAAALFTKGNDKLYHWLTNHKIFGELIRDFHENKAIPLHAKITAISMMLASMTYAIFFVAKDKLWLQILLASIAIGVTIHILRYKTKKNKH